MSFPPVENIRREPYLALWAWDRLRARSITSSERSRSLINTTRNFKNFHFGAPPNHLKFVSRLHHCRLVIGRMAESTLHFTRDGNRNRARSRCLRPVVVRHAGGGRTELRLPSEPLDNGPALTDLWQRPHSTQMSAPCRQTIFPYKSYCEMMLSRARLSTTRGVIFAEARIVLTVEATPY